MINALTLNIKKHAYVVPYNYCSVAFHKKEINNLSVFVFFLTVCIFLTDFNFNLV